MLEKVITAPTAERIGDVFLELGHIYCVVDRDQKSVGRFYEFHEAVTNAEKWAIDYPKEAPFSIEKREKIWFSDRSISKLLEAKR